MKELRIINPATLATASSSYPAPSAPRGKRSRSPDDDVTDTSSSGSSETLSDKRLRPSNDDATDTSSSCSSKNLGDHCLGHTPVSSASLLHEAYGNLFRPPTSMSDLTDGTSSDCSVSAEHFKASKDTPFSPPLSHSTSTISKSFASLSLLPCLGQRSQSDSILRKVPVQPDLFSMSQLFTSISLADSDSDHRKHTTQVGAAIDDDYALSYSSDSDGEDEELAIADSFSRSKHF